MATKSGKKQSSPGAPQWTYIAGAIVAIATLGWAVASFFIPKPEPAKPPVASAPAPATPPNGGSTSSQGDHNVVVGSMSGGSITNGADANQPAGTKKK